MERLRGLDDGSDATPRTSPVGDLAYRMLARRVDIALFLQTTPYDFDHHAVA